MTRIALTCENCGCIIGNRDRHSARCRTKPALIPQGECAETTSIRDGKGYARSGPRQTRDEHEIHQAEFEGYRHRWYTPELVDEGLTVEVDDGGNFEIPA